VALQISHTDQENIGIRAPYNTPCPVISQNDLSFLNKAISTHSSGGIEIVDNTFADNYKAISFTNPSTLTSIELNCNEFSLALMEPYDRYGLFIENGADIFTDFGGDGGFTVFDHPAGNNWPVDPAQSNGYPFTAGPTGDPFYPDVANWWAAPGNWYSIYDEFAFLTGEDPVSYGYYSYYNEFVGENPDPNQNTDPMDAVVPTSVVKRISNLNSGYQFPDYLGQNNSTCFLSPNISFPPLRIFPYFIASVDPSRKEIEILVYPVPLRNQLNVEIETAQRLFFNLFDQQANKIWTQKFGLELDRHFLNLPNLLPGMYILEIIFESKETKRLKVVKY
jgi:hypothetical protein